MRKLLPILLLAGITLPLIGCGKEADTTDGAKDKVEEAADGAGDQADDVDHGSGSGKMDHTGAGEAKGEGKKHE